MLTGGFPWPPPRTKSPFCGSGLLALNDANTWPTVDVWRCPSAAIVAVGVPPSCHYEVFQCNDPCEHQQQLLCPLARCCSGAVTVWCPLFKVKSRQSAAHRRHMHVGTFGSVGRVDNKGQHASKVLLTPYRRVAPARRWSNCRFRSWPRLKRSVNSAGTRRSISAPTSGRSLAEITAECVQSAF